MVCYYASLHWHCNGLFTPRHAWCAIVLVYIDSVTAGLFEVCAIMLGSSVVV